jgi:hypothetical protein
MIESIAEATIKRPPEAIIAFVTDLEQYKLADWKIGRVLECRHEGDAFIMRHDGKLRGVPGPAVSLEMRVNGMELRYKDIPTFPSRLALTFDGGFDLFPNGEHTRVVHTERFRFKAPVRWVAEPLLRTWLQQDIEKEMVRLREILEAQ